jgi:hypothetical protein
MVSSQKVALTSAVNAFGPAAVPCRNEVLVRPPPTTGSVGSEDTSRVAVSTIVLPIRPDSRTEFGLVTIAWVIPTMSACGERSEEGVERLDSVKLILFVGWFSRNGVISTMGILGGPGLGDIDKPCASTVVP